MVVVRIDCVNMTMNSFKSPTMYKYLLKTTFRTYFFIMCEKEVEKIMESKKAVKGKISSLLCFHT